METIQEDCHPATSQSSKTSIIQDGTQERQHECQDSTNLEMEQLHKSQAFPDKSHSRKTKLPGGHEKHDGRHKSRCDADYLEPGQAGNASRL